MRCWEKRSNVTNDDIHAHEVLRPAVSTERLSLTAQGHIRYRLVAPAHPCARDIRASLHIKTPYRDGTTYVVFPLLDFMTRLAALVPTPRAHALPRRLVDGLARRITDCVNQ